MHLLLLIFPKPTTARRSNPKLLYNIVTFPRDPSFFASLRIDCRFPFDERSKMVPSFVNVMVLLLDSDPLVGVDGA